MTRLARVTAPLVLAAACAGPASSASQAPAAGAASFVRSGTLLVANQASANASIIDLATGTMTLVPVGTGPHEAVISPDGRLGVVTVYGSGPAPGNQLAIIDMGTRAIARMVNLGDYRRPHDITFLPGSSNRVVVTSEASQNVVVVDVVAGTVESAVGTQAPGSHSLALAADGRTLFTANVPAGSVSHLDLVEQKLIRHVPVGPGAEGIAITPDGREVWAGSNQAGTITIIDVATGSVVETLRDLGMPYRITISPDGRWAMIPDPPNNRVHVADVTSRRVVGAITGIGSPRGVEIAPDNRTAYVTLGPENSVLVVDLVERRVIAEHPVGTAPDGVGFGIRRGPAGEGESKS